MNKITYIALMLLGLASSSVVAQSRKDSLTTKVVDVVKSYAPTIADAEKKREDAKVKDSLTVKKKQINYTINSVPVASTFVPDKGKAATVKQKVIRGDYQDSYIGGGFGMLNTFYADANITYNLNDNGKASFLLNHLSSSDEIEEVFPEMNYSNSSAEIRYDYQSQELLWGINADISRRLHNWYGIRENTFTRNQLRGKVDDMQQIYFDYGLAGYLQWANPYFKGLDFSFRGLSDHFESKELNVKAQPSFEVPLTDEQKINANVLVDYYDGSFTRKYNTINEINNRWMLFGINPSYQMDIDNLNLGTGFLLEFIHHGARSIRIDTGHVKNGQLFPRRTLFLIRIPGLLFRFFPAVLCSAAATDRRDRKRRYRQNRDPSFFHNAPPCKVNHFPRKPRFPVLFLSLWFLYHQL